MSDTMFTAQRRFDILGTTKLSRGVSSDMAAFGSTNAPVEISGTSGVEGDDGRDVRTTLAKCVGTDTFGGLPITSYDFRTRGKRRATTG